RMSEQYGLRWSQVDFERRQIHLPKTKNGDPRTIPLNAVALDSLLDLRDENLRGENLNGGDRKGAGKRKGTDPVFPSLRSGDALQGSRGWFPTALAAAQIDGYSWHCNRHTFASRLVMAGVDLRTVAELLGHRTLQMVMRYSHLAPEHQASAVEQLVRGKNQRDTKADTGSFQSKKTRELGAVNIRTSAV
ncbi:MAG: site-specific integrase, partial [Silvibacterium sp.]